LTQCWCACVAGDGCAIRCSYKADDGFLYPLDKAFFYVHKPPMCINHSDIEYVEFQRQGGGVISSSVRTFDLLIKQRSNNTVRGLFSCCTYISAAIPLLSSSAA
jgi:structure-specific recognition protein 1